MIRPQTEGRDPFQMLPHSLPEKGEGKPFA